MQHSFHCTHPPPQAQVTDYPVYSPLLLQASSGVKQWNKRWFVLVDRCLFYYKGELAPGTGRGCGKPGPPLSHSALSQGSVSDGCWGWGGTYPPCGLRHQWHVTGDKDKARIHSLISHSAIFTERLRDFRQSSRPWWVV